jgi:DNA-binding CsgD family transcriptional regulator
MRIAARRNLAILGIVSACFVWTMIIVGLSFAMVERGSQQWWLVPLFGALMPVIALFAVHAAHRFWSPSADVEPEGVPPTPAVRRTRVLSEPLSARELEVLEQLAVGSSNKEIAAALFVATGTVKAHLNHIFRKLDASSRLQAVVHAREAGLLAEGPDKPR